MEKEIVMVAFIPQDAVIEFCPGEFRWKDEPYVSFGILTDLKKTKNFINRPYIEFFTKRFWNLLLFNRLLFEKFLGENDRSLKSGDFRWEANMHEVFRKYQKFHKKITLDEYKEFLHELFKNPFFERKKLINDCIEDLRKKYNNIYENHKYSLFEYKENIERLFVEYDKNVAQQEKLKGRNNGN